LRCQKVLDDLKLKGEEKIGADIVRRALEDPLRKIADNAGKDGSVVVAEVKRLIFTKGYDASEDKFVDMIESGIIDPTKVARSCIENALSAASMLLTTECVVADIKEETPAPNPAAMGGMGGMM
jgi:chaperonin GroEL